MLPAGPSRPPATGSTQKAPLGKAAHPSSWTSPVLRFPRIRRAAPNSSQPTAAMRIGATIWRNSVSRHAENSPRSAAVATSCSRR